MVARVYIDAFNLYYGSLKGTPHRWLNILALSRSLVGGEPDLVRYFTARVRATALSGGAEIRQAEYLRALVTLPKVEIHFGHYVIRQKRAREAAPPHNRVDVLHTEEKGSDVNLATYLVADGHRGLFDKALVVTNDSDLAFPVRYVRDELKLRVVVVNPHPAKKRSGHLLQAASAVRQIRPGVLARCQLPNPVPDGASPISKPPSW